MKDIEFLQEHSKAFKYGIWKSSLLLSLRSCVYYLDYIERSALCPPGMTHAHTSIPH